ncbi:histidine phosphatase family protein [Maritimibacter alkaliphilus]|uniref:histidine phosphatase family protein n=1 Tax=Maritimibacter alkaliphilus TaxID=404236 RepID=UPI001C97F06D|nr:histidine phosphatase family protein [Maritimibacter alkaliphilus]MBY6092050.1 histidine phosphatase family protein [Maritimibacter alkaliphilus]
MVSRRRIIRMAAGFGLVGAAGCALSGRERMAPNSRLIVLRHADRAGEVLTDKGEARARALVTALEGLPVDAIYTPGIHRNEQTAAPLAAARGLPLETLSVEDPTAELIRRGAGRSVVWVGNKNNLAVIWDTLAQPDPPPVDYGDLFILESDATGRVKLERRRVPAERG